METLELKIPIKINGKDTKKFQYDPEELTAEQYIEACRRSAQPGEIDIAEGDYALHFYLGCELIISSNPDVDITDLERVKGFDIIRISNLGRNFILAAQADYEEETSEEPSDSTADSSTPAKQTSAKKG